MLGGWNDIGESDLVVTTHDDSEVAFINGQITVVGSSYSQVKVRYDEEYKAYSFGEHLDHLIQTCVRLGLSFTCDFRGDGEESSDIWRTRVNNCMFIYSAANPVFLWPDGEQTPS